MQKMVEESDAQQAAISRQRQVLSEQMAETTHAVNTTTEHLQAVLEDKKQKLLAELYDKVLTTDEALNKVMILLFFLLFD